MACNHGTRNITRTLVKIPGYAKGVIQQTGRHHEKASSIKSDGNFKLFSTALQHSFLSNMYAISGRANLVAIPTSFPFFCAFILN